MVIDKIARRNEDIWFREKEKELIAKFKQEREKRIKEEQEKEALHERERLRKAHWMHCPKCGHQMKEKDLHGIKLDICGHCEGIYFDRGELEDLIVKRQSDERRGFFRWLMGVSKEAK